MKKMIQLCLLFGMLAVSGFSATPEAPAENVPVYSVKCCKICKKGKACGDSCISRELTCHKKKGCACDG